MTAITGCPEHGSSLRSACCGRRDIGDGAADSTSGMADTGVRTSASTAALITDSATPASDLGAANGAVATFYYNRSVTNVSVTNVTNVYNRTVVVNNRSTTSFNGGTGGVQARPTHQEEQLRTRAAYGGPCRSEPSMSARQPQPGESSVPESWTSGDRRHSAGWRLQPPGSPFRPGQPAANIMHPAISPREARVNPASGNRGNSNAGNRMNTGNNNGNNNKARSNERLPPFHPAGEEQRGKWTEQ